MSSPTSSTIGTADWIPAEGFLHRRPSSPATARQKPVWQLRNDRLNKEVTAAVGRLAIRDRTVLASDARSVLVEALEATAASRSGDDRKESTLDFLERIKDSIRLGRELSNGAWIELIYRLVWARDRYLRQGNADKFNAERENVSALALAVDKLYEAAGKHGNEWDWLAMEIYNDPKLNGEQDDNDIEEQE
ncbi:hypothetical protein QBC41DRAFT_379939 [Cercophora samala]|uniref:Uncharacterized protein n=1 Tax=Cercophora samala TaxID=330535 RepID=A0AA39Z7T1_9PEZI|nr:hypothetical protein QBC41DRAFT_379939 [Cercophora samala]